MYFDPGKPETELLISLNFKYIDRSARKRVINRCSPVLSVGTISRKKKKQEDNTCVVPHVLEYYSTEKEKEKGHGEGY
jgi:hypothetical protein